MIRLGMAAVEGRDTYIFGNDVAEVPTMQSALVEARKMRGTSLFPISAEIRVGAIAGPAIGFRRFVRLTLQTGRVAIAGFERGLDRLARWPR